MAKITNEIIAAYRSSELTQKEFCRRRKISVSTLQYHLRKANEKKKSKKDQSPGEFFPIHVTSKPSGATVIIIQGQYTSEDVSSIISGVLRK